MSQPKTEPPLEKIQVRSNIAWQTLDDEVVLLDLTQGTAIGFNPTASHIWKLLCDHDEHAIVASVVDAFAVDEETARRDVRLFIASCLDQSLVCCVPVGSGE